MRSASLLNHISIGRGRPPPGGVFGAGGPPAGVLEEAFGMPAASVSAADRGQARALTCMSCMPPPQQQRPHRAFLRYVLTADQGRHLTC